MASDVTLLERAVNGQPGLVALRGIVVIDAVIAFAVAGDLIRHDSVVRNPDKLRPGRRADGERGAGCCCVALST